MVFSWSCPSHCLTEVDDLYVWWEILFQISLSVQGLHTFYHEVGMSWISWNLGILLCCCEWSVQTPDSMLAELTKPPSLVHKWLDLCWTSVHIQKDKLKDSGILWRPKYVITSIYKIPLLLYSAPLMVLGIQIIIKIVMVIINAVLQHIQSDVHPPFLSPSPLLPCVDYWWARAYLFCRYWHFCRHHKAILLGYDHHIWNS